MDKIDNLKSELRFCLERARAWRTQKGLQEYYRFYWTRTLADKQHAAFMARAGEVRYLLNFYLKEQHAKTSQG